MGDSQKEEEGRKWGNKNNFTPFPVPSPKVHSNSKSNMAGRINDRKFVVLTLGSPQWEAFCASLMIPTSRIQLNKLLTLKRAKFEKEKKSEGTIDLYLP